MITRQVESAVYPKPFEVLQGKKLINVQVTENESEDGVIYSYTQIVTSIGSDVDSIIAQHEYEWTKKELSKSDIEIIYHERNSTRATATIEEWFEYQETLRDYATYENGTYSVLTERPVQPT